MSTGVEVNGSEEVAGCEPFVVPHGDLKTAAVLQLIARDVSEYELLVPRRILTVVDDWCLATVFASSIH